MKREACLPNQPANEVADSPEGRSKEPAEGSGVATAYRSAFRSASIMGGASALNMAIGLVRAKVMAVLLGPAGTGLMGLYGQITGLTGTISNFGITSSGVRQIAEAAGTGDDSRIAVTDLTVRRVAWVTGSLGLLLQISLCWLLSRWTFGDTAHWQAIALLAVVPLLGALSGAQVARIQGLRHIGDLARQSVLGALAGTISGVALIWFFGFKGIVPQLIAVSAFSLALSFYFSRKIRIAKIKVPWRETVREAKSLLGLGFSFMASSVSGMVATYLISIMIAHKLGVQANGLYFAAWSLSGLYANFVLNAMGADYYPRLTAVANDQARMIQMVNQQAEISLLIAVPGIVGTLAFAPIAIRVFYSPAYAGAYEAMRWLILGVFLRLVSWPLGFILLAKGAAGLFLVTEILHQVINVFLVFALIGPYGLTGAGAAFAFLYVLYSFIILLIVVWKYKFRYSPQYLPLLAITLALTLSAFILRAVSNEGLRYGLGAGLSVAACLVCGLMLKRLMGLRDMKEVVQMAASLVGLNKKRNAAP
jgi:PST family polysaccharide transporter